MATTVKDGKALEQLVAIIEKVVAGNANVAVEQDKRLFDKFTGKERQFDVVLTVTHQHHTVLIAIECRDKTKPVGVGQVEEFYTKCQHTGVNQAVIVSTSGFANTARTKADLLGIKCLDIEEVSSFNWMLAQGMRLIETKPLGQDWKFWPVTEGLVDASNVELLDDAGNVVSNETLSANATRFFHENLPELPPPTERAELVVRFGGDGLSLRNSLTGATTPVKNGLVRLTYSISHSIAPHRLVQYVDKADDKHVTDAAVSEFRFGDKTMRMIIVYKEDEGGQVYLTVAPSKAK